MNDFAAGCTWADGGMGQVVLLYHPCADSVRRRGLATGKHAAAVRLRTVTAVVGAISPRSVQDPVRMPKLHCTNFQFPMRPPTVVLIYASSPYLFFRRFLDDLVPNSILALTISVCTDTRHTSQPSTFGRRPSVSVY